MFVRDIRSFLDEGETWDTTVASSMSTIMQRAMDACTALYAAQSSCFGKFGFRISIPAGTVRLDTAIEWKTGVGARGPGHTSPGSSRQSGASAFQWDVAPITTPAPGPASTNSTTAVALPAIAVGDDLEVWVTDATTMFVKINGVQVWAGQVTPHQTRTLAAVGYPTGWSAGFSRSWAVAVLDPRASRFFRTLPNGFSTPTYINCASPIVMSSETRSMIGST